VSLSREATDTDARFPQRGDSRLTEAWSRSHAVALDGAQVVATGSLRVSLRFLAYVVGVDLRSPFNFELTMIDRISPAPQAGLREFRRRGMLRERHVTPGQRRHMHRPEHLRRCSPSA
jgi:hypothetical protein